MSQKVCRWVDVAQLSMTLMNRMYRFSRELHCLPFLLLHKPAKKARICIIGSEGEWISLSRLLSLPFFSAGITHYFSCFSALSLFPSLSFPSRVEWPTVWRMREKRCSRWELRAEKNQLYSLHFVRFFVVFPLLLSQRLVLPLLLFAQHTVLSDSQVFSLNIFSLSHSHSATHPHHTTTFIFFFKSCILCMYTVLPLLMSFYCPILFPWCINTYTDIPLHYMYSHTLL